MKKVSKTEKETKVPKKPVPRPEGLPKSKKKLNASQGITDKKSALREEPTSYRRKKGEVKPKAQSIEKSSNLSEGKVKLKSRSKSNGRIESLVERGYPTDTQSMLREGPGSYGIGSGTRKTNLRFIDLFAGIGGIRLGLERAGGECVFSSEWDEEAGQTYMACLGGADLTEWIPSGSFTTTIN